MQIAQLIEYLNGQGVFPYLADGKLKTRSTSDTLEPAVVAAIRAAKDELIAFLAQESQGAADAIAPLAGDAGLPLSFNQERLWLTNQIGEGSAQYNITQALRLDGALDRAALGRALDALVERHAVLRTTYSQRDGVALQTINPAAPLPLLERDLSGLSGAAQEAAVAQAAQEQAGLAFDLERDAMLRVLLLALGAGSHVVVFTMHHIASDGWSMALLARDFVQLYQAFSAGGANPLAPLPLRYVDYAAWQRERLSGAALEQELDFWQQRLAGIPKLHGLPLDHARPAQQQFTGQRIEQRIDRTLLERLYRLGERQGATFFMVLQAAYALLLSRWSGEDDIVVGCPVAGRTRQELEPVIGFFANALVYRTDLSGQPSFEQLLARVKAYALDVFSHQEMPFETLAKNVQVERSLAYSPVFQVSLTLQNNDAARLELPGLAVSSVNFESNKTLFDLSVFAREAEDGLYLSWLFADQLFERATIERMAASFAVLLQGACDDPAQPAHRLPLTDSQPLASQTSVDPATPVIRQFEAQAAASPSAIAVACAGNELEYAALNAEANRLARHLLSKGVQRDAVVALCLERSVESLLAMLAVQKAGAAYLPLDPGLPAERLQALMDDAGVDLVLTQQSLMSELPFEGRSLVPLDPMWRKALLKNYADDNLSEAEAAVDGAGLAYVIYTSGSTGQPKGVMIEHAGLARSALAQREAYGVNSSSVVLQFVSFSFDVAVADWAMALSCGATLCIAEEAQRLNGAALAQLAGSYRASHLQVPAPVLAQLDAAAFPSLHTVIVGGSASNAAVLSQWMPGRRCFNAYGPTEAVIASGARLLQSPEEHGNIGHPFGHVRYYVLDEAGQPLPDGAPGELYIGGAALARGYLNAPEMTAQRFLDDPFAGSGRMYRTCDLVRRTASGELAFIGRTDEQVKLRGYRIELGEIRTQLLRHRDVREALVLVDGDSGAQRLLAYLVPQQGASADGLADSVRAQLQQVLPDYMVPAGFAVLERLPLTVNGKVDRKALPAIALASAAAEFSAPRNDTESVLCAIWAQLLKAEQVGIHDNFFALGGDSILSIQVVARANQAGIGITTRQLFAHQTVAELAAQAVAAGVQSPQEEVQGGLAMLPIQRHFVEISHGALGHFNQSVLLLPPAGLDESMLRKMVEAVYRRHDALRLQWQREDDGAWSAQHMPLDAARLKSAVCLESLPGDPAAHSAFVAERCGFWQRASDPCQGPLLRAVLFTGSAPRLFLVAHHLVVDGVSWRILLADLEQAYRQLGAGQAIQLAPKSASLQQWGAAVEQYAQSPRLAAELPFWLAQLEQPVAALPQRAAGAAPAQSSTRTASLALTAQETDALLRHCGQRYRTQINELLLAGVYLGMQRWSGAEGVRLLLEGHGRADLDEAIDTSQTVGWFTSTYPLALRCGSGDVGEVIMQVKEQYRAVPQQGFGYGVLRHVAGEARLAQAEAAHPAQLVFNYLGQFDQSVGGDSLFRAAHDGSGAAIDPARARHCLLGLNGKVAGGVLGFTLDYSSEQFDAEAMAALAQQIEAGLRDVVQHCAHAPAGQFTPGDFPLAKVSRAELDGWQREYAIAKLYPATPMQQGMQFHSELDAGAYVSQCCPQLEGALDAAAFRAAWQAVTAHYDIFRTAFVGQGDRLHQLVQPSAELPWVEEDWRHLDEAAQRARFAQVCADDRAGGFDAARAPLQRIALYRLGEQRYQLLWSHHHMLLDGWCTPLVYRDVMDAYRAIAAGEAPALAQVAPYERYIGWLSEQDQDAAQRYWRDYLAALEAPTPLPFGLSQQREAGQGEQRLHLDRGQTARLEECARRHHTTVNTLLQLAWGYLLHRYSGEQHVLFGTTISGRPAEVADVERMVGLFINTVPVRVSFDGDDGIGSLLAGLHGAFQRSTGFGYLPLTTIRACSRLAPGGAFFDSMLVFENYPLDAAQEGDAAARHDALRIAAYESFEAAGYPLALSVSLRDTLNIKCRYSRERFADATMIRLLQHLELVLAQLAGAENLGQVELLGGEELRMLQQWQGPARSFGRELCLHQLFEAQAARAPQQAALEWQGRSLSYGELNRCANQVAQRLVAQGVKPDTLVGICVERSLEMVVGILAILKAGGAYLPLDPLYRAERLRHILQDSGTGLVLSMSAAFSAGLPPQVRSLDLDIDALLADATPAADLAPASLGLRPEHLAYVIYTSGSTGLPKGVMVEHRGLVNLIEHDIGLFEVGPQSRVLHCASMSFDAGTAHLFKGLCSGAATCLVTPEADLVEAMQQLGVTHAAFPTAILEAQRRAPVPTLRTVIVGGDACPKALVEYWSAQCRFFNVYGPTEATIASSAAALTPDCQVTIGRPIANVEFHVLDAAMRPVPAMVPGELYIAGAGLARGYLNREELTAERFITPAGGPLAGKRLYRSGDLVRYLDDGRVEFLGRVDEQVKLRGLRIEPGEIAARLRELEQVSDAVVLLCDAGRDKALVAYVVPRCGSDEAQQLVPRWREALAQVLPAYMVPARFILLQQFPLSPNGKLDRRALPLPQLEGSIYVAPRNATEAALQQAWQQLLGLDQVGVEDNYFALGGNSLQLSRLSYELRSAFAIELPVKSLFGVPTIAAMAQLVDALRAVQAENDNNDIEMEGGVL